MSGGPVLIVGASQRCGTNWLHALLDLHPDLAAPATLHEDYLPAGATALLDGCRSITGNYPPDWIAPHEADAALTRRVGQALLGWLAADAGLATGDPRRLLSKTPGAAGVADLATLLPDASLLLLVRDGRDVVASGMRGLGWSFTEGVDRWLNGVRGVLTLTGRPLPPGVRVRLVRYEDIVADPPGQVTALLTWLGLDPARWDPAAAADLPVIGSSFHTGPTGQLDWTPVPRPDGFDPRGRADAWSPQLHARFLLRGATSLQALGYPVERPAATAATGAALAKEFARGAKRTAAWLIGGT